MFHLDLSPAFGQPDPMLISARWSDKPLGCELTLSDYAEKCFQNAQSFFLVITQYLGTSSKPVPLREYLKLPTSELEFTALYLFSSPALNEPFRFQLALPKKRNLKFRLHVLKHLDCGEWVHPNKFMKFIADVPRTAYWLQQIADYAFTHYGPELLEWKQLVKEINEFSNSIEDSNPNPSVTVGVFRALDAEDSCAAFTALDITRNLHGCAFYVYYSLFHKWERKPELEKHLKDCFKDKKRDSTQIFCLAQLTMTHSLENMYRSKSLGRAHHYLRSYKRHAKHGVSVDKILKDIKKQFEMALFYQKNQSNENLLLRGQASYYLSEIFKYHNRSKEATQMRQEASRVAALHKANPNDPLLLELKALLHRNSPLAQDRALAERYRSRSLSNAEHRSPNQSPRWENESPRLEVPHDASDSSGTPRPRTLSNQKHS